jgi:putative endonuclease
MALHNQVGRTGEDIAVQFLVSKQYTILERNHRKPYGEIDIIATQGNKTHFVEVKTVSCEMDKETLSRETGHRPEDNVHSQKAKRIMRVIEGYIVSHETDQWCFDVICVYLDTKKRAAKVKFIKDIVLN